MNRNEAKDICISFVKQSEGIEFIGIGFNDITEDLFYLGLSCKDRVNFLQIAPFEHNGDSLVKYISNKLKDFCEVK